MSKFGDNTKKLWSEWRSVKASSGFRKVLTYLVFVIIATLFWFILALNDNMQEDFEVRVNIYNVPDTVNFITLPPQKIHVTVRDKGTTLWQRGVFGRPTMDVNFRDHAADGVFRLNRSELNASLKNLFGTNASLISSSIDSLRLTYTTLPGKRVPIVAVSDLTAASGKVIRGLPALSPNYVTVYSTRDVLDTITRVFTNNVYRKNMEESEELVVKIHGVRGARISPESVKMKITVEPLVRKRTNVNIRIDNVPTGMDLLLFPSNTNVEYFLPMSDFNSDGELVEVSVDYRDLKPGSKKLPLHLVRHGRSITNVEVLTDSVEFTLVRE